MRITVVAVGKVKERYIEEGVGEYLKRLAPYAKVSLVEVPDERVPENPTPREVEQVKAKEGRRLLQKVPPDSLVVALAIEGKSFTSEAWALKMEGWALSGRSHLTFLIGGTLGLSPEVLQRADLLLSFSAMTFPHQLVRLLLLEQLYRAFKIQRGEPYHK